MTVSRCLSTFDDARDRGGGTKNQVEVECPMRTIDLHLYTLNDV